MIVIVDFANNSIEGTEVGKVGKVGSGRKMDEGVGECLQLNSDAVKLLNK